MKKTPKEAAATRRKILASALALFTKRGYEHTTFTDIAARLHLTKGAVYWYFDTKEDLLIALVDEMLAKFERQITELMPRGELTFTTVADMMVKNAELIVQDPKGVAFFMLMRTQIKWRAATMRGVRENLMKDDHFGPYHAFVKAIENEKRVKTVKSTVESKSVAATCVAIWDGLVQGHIDHFFMGDLCGTLANAFNAIYNSIKK